MSERAAVALAVLAVLALPAFGATGAQAATTNWTVDETSLSVTFEPGDGNSLTREVTVTNNDRNQSVDLSASIGGGHSVESAPTLGPGESTTLTVTLNADGDRQATLSISGGGKTVNVDVTVVTPAYIEISGLPAWMENEGVLVGTTRTAQITVEEVGGYQGFSGVEVSASGNVNLYGLRQASVSAGGQTTVEISFTAPSDAEQHADIGGTFTLDPQNDGSSVTSSVTLETWVAYPPAFGDVHLTGDTFVFDEPRSRGQLQKQVELVIPNTGDRPLDVASASLSSGAFDQVSVSGLPDTIPGGESRTAEVTVVASTDLGEGTYSISGTVQSGDVSVESASLSDELEVVHEVDLGVSTDRVRLGDVPIGQTGTGSVVVTETLGYQPIPGLEMRKTAGPDSWISVTNGPPSTLSAGGSARISYEVSFDPNADIGTTYRWTYVFEGETGGSEKVTVSATPIPLNLEPIQRNLSSLAGSGGATGEMASRTLEMVKMLNQGIREGSIKQQDIASVLTFSDGVIRFIEATNRAQRLLEADEHEAAQEQIIQAAVAYDTMRTYAKAIQDDELAAATEPILAIADERLSSLVERQRSYYQQRLNSADVSPLQKAAIKRELALMATLQGNQQRARQLNQEADAAFKRYKQAVARAEAARQRAASIWNEMKAQQFTMVLGQPVMLNPMQYPAFQAKSDALLSAYETAESAYRAAGETELAEAVAATQAQRRQQLTIARYTLFASIGLTLLIAAGLVAWTGRGMYWYVQDSREAVTGDFLV